MRHHGYVRQRDKEMEAYVPETLRVEDKRLRKPRCCIVEES
jgi:hypothetical protein